MNFCDVDAISIFSKQKVLGFWCFLHSLLYYKIEQIIIFFFREKKDLLFYDFCTKIV